MMEYGRDDSRAARRSYRLLVVTMLVAAAAGVVVGVAHNGAEQAEPRAERPVDHAEEGRAETIEGIVVVRSAAQPDWGSISLGVRGPDGDNLTAFIAAVAGTSYRDELWSDTATQVSWQLEPGFYTITIAKPGFGTVIEQQVEVYPGLSTIRDIILARRTVSPS